VTVCPFGAMNFNPGAKKVFKCDLCDGEPQCVRFCDMKAVDYVDSRKESSVRKRDAALKMAEAKKVGSAMEYEG
jgi:Fe-S-cluster-containing hydrogenase component 2